MHFVLYFILVLCFREIQWFRDKPHHMQPFVGAQIRVPHVDRIKDKAPC